MLQRQVDQSAEGLRDWNHRPHEDHREPGGPEQPGASKEQHHASGVDDGDQGQGWKLQQPVFIDGDNEQHLIAQEHERGRAGKNGEAPPRAFRLPVQALPGAQNQQIAD